MKTTNRRPRGVTVTVVTVGRCGGAWPERVEAVERMTRGRGGVDAWLTLLLACLGLSAVSCRRVRWVERMVRQLLACLRWGLVMPCCTKRGRAKGKRLGEGFSRATKIRGGRSMPIPQLICTSLTPLYRTPSTQTGPRPPSQDGGGSVGAREDKGRTLSKANQQEAGLRGLGQRKATPPSSRSCGAGSRSSFASPHWLGWVPTKVSKQEL